MPKRPLGMGVAAHLSRRDISLCHGGFDPSASHEATDLNISGLTLVEVGVKVSSRVSRMLDIYTRCDDTNRRLCNQAFFTKVFIDEDNELRVEHNRPFEMLLDPQVNANALTWAADTNKTRTSTNVSVGKGSSLVRAVEHRGFEPLTSSMPWKRATNCAIAPFGRRPRAATRITV